MLNSFQITRSSKTEINKYALKIFGCGNVPYDLKIAVSL